MKIPFGPRVLDIARYDLATQLYVESAVNDGPEIVARFLAPNGLHPGQPWCAAAMRTWVKQAAADLGVEPPVLGPNLARGWIPKFQAVGGWLDAPLTLADLEPGDVFIWKHALAGRDPEYTDRGHIALFDHEGPGGLALSLDGNSGPLGDRVALMARQLDDPRLLGRGRFPDVEATLYGLSTGSQGSALPLLLLGAATLFAVKKL